MATTRTIPETDSVEAMRQAQSSVILSALDDFLRGKPDREVRLSYSPIDGFHVELREYQESRGESLRDACGQVCTVLLMTEETAR
jgi:hypothetical protein